MDFNTLLNTYCRTYRQDEKQRCLEEILEVAKQLLPVIKIVKSEVVVFINDKMIGTDQNCIYFTETTLSPDIVSLIIKYNIKSLLVKEIEKIVKNYEYLDTPHVRFNDEVSEFTVLTSYRQVCSLLYNRANNNIASLNKDLTNDETFLNVINSKAKDGASIINIMGYPVTIYSSLLPINKGDSVQIDIIDNGGSTFLGIYTIQKKKNVKILVYIRFLKV